ncbi:DUF6879 family protein [Streptomyces sp. B6B3]|uniref:DUF6879 family protein n=1 Tax=Streptomyces sp. B6B3 TaxID=3153570 RepID=UPI00325EC04F
MRLDGEEWPRFFDSFKRAAWRLETLPVYRMPGEQDDLARFRATGKVEVPEDSAWRRRIRHFCATGRTIGRVHVVTRPLTDYLRWEFAFQAHSVRAGEEIRVLDLTDRANPGLPGQDFWMLDDQIVEMRYDSEGHQIGRFLLDDPDLDQYREWKRIAVEHSVPLAEFEEAHLAR